MWAEMSPAGSLTTGPDGHGADDVTSCQVVRLAALSRCLLDLCRLRGKLTSRAIRSCGLGSRLWIVLECDMPAEPGADLPETLELGHRCCKPSVLERHRRTDPERRVAADVRSTGSNQVGRYLRGRGACHCRRRKPALVRHMGDCVAGDGRLAGPVAPVLPFPLVRLPWTQSTSNAMNFSIP